MYLEHFALSHAPFSTLCNPDVFFAESPQWQVYQSLVVDILAGTSLLTLTGPEGVGKSHLLAVLAQRLPASQQVILIDSPAAPLPELLWSIVPAFNLPGETPQEYESLIPAMQQCAEQRRAEGKRIVLLVDAAEQLSAETLEGLLKLVGTGSGETGLSLLLTGRDGLKTILGQVVTQGEDFAKGYTLEPLTESETRQYLRFCATEAGMSRADYAEVFTESVVTKIFKSAQGNMHLSNILAEEVLQNFCAEKSFMVLLDQVDSETPETTPTPANRLARLITHARSMPFWGSGLIIFLVIALVSGTLFLVTKKAPAPPQTVTENNIAESRVGATQPSGFHAGTSTLEKGTTLLQARIAASAPWLHGELQEKYTIQLMRLSSSSAEYSLASTLGSDAYAPVLDQVYVLRNQQSPPTIFVYYGVYDTLDAAREARNTMPLFLQQQGPYPLVIAEAVEKIKVK
nr:AAA family ATPase [uncultured Desulfobulbus sp.]